MNPSGQAIPTAHRKRGPKRVFADDFNQPLTWPCWQVYNGEIPGDCSGVWATNHAVVRDGCLELRGYRDPDHDGRYVTAGVSTRFNPVAVRTYGKFLVRMRADVGEGVAVVAILWPADNSWPPEVDFVEDNGADRQTNYATMHYGTPEDHHSDAKELAVDLSQWHTHGVELTPGRLVYTVDGHEWAEITENVPDVPMALCLQTQAWGIGESTWEHGVLASTPDNVNLYVDWVAIYAPAAP
jgi:beta-glucanase (GH16 family)